MSHQKSIDIDESKKPTESTPLKDETVVRRRIALESVLTPRPLEEIRKELEIRARALFGAKDAPPNNFEKE
jgi:hypothetical protein